jgi:2-polyprenyl-6-methoxyphenol hydroxylase-like FAD-dependent oxidoreductase
MVQSINGKKVLVVGAGPVGLTMAFELQRRGISCCIIDKESAPTTQSRALAIHARTLEAFENMGIVDEILKAGQKLHAVNIYVHERRILHLTMDELESPYPFIISLPQAETERILASELKKSGIEVARGTELIEVSQDAEHVYATLKHADASISEETFDWLIACDGAHSTIRHKLNLEFKGSRYPDAFILADVNVKTTLPQTEAHMFHGEDGILAMFPYGNDRFRLLADVPFDSPLIKPTENQDKDVEATRETPEKNRPEENTADAAHGGGIPRSHLNLKKPTLEEFQDIVDKRGPSGLQISNPIWLATFAIQRRSVNHYRKERIFLAGDASHIHSPAGGQGMNTGIQDAYNLAWKLALVIEGASPVSLLDSYDSERHTIAKGVLKMTDFLTKVNTSRNPVARNIRAHLAPILVAQEVIQQRMRKTVSELAINYRKSLIVSEHKVDLVHALVPDHSSEEQPDISDWFSFDHGPGPGDRAPDASLFDGKTESPLRLFEALSDTKHHLLLLSGARNTSSGLKNLEELSKFVIDKYSRWITVHLIVAEQTYYPDFPANAPQLCDPDLSMHHKYGANSECLYLIRPDGYIGFRSLPVDLASLKKYLEQIFVTR